MNFKAIAESWYTNKRIDSNRRISEKEIEELKHILKLTPSSIYSQPWKFTFISNEVTKNELAITSLFNIPKIKIQGT